MRTLVRLRWPLLLALAGALLAPWLSWDFMIFLIGMVVAERLASHLWLRACRARMRPQERETAMAPESPRAARMQRGASIALIRVLDAACPSCQGHGCETCAYTGLD
jgi:hypothetical protein